MGFERSCHFIGVNLNIMIAENGENTQPGPQPTQHLGDRPNVIRGKGYVMSRECDQVWLEVVGHFYSPFDIFEGGIEAMVNVSELDNPQAVIRRAKPADVNVHLCYFGIGRSWWRRKWRVVR